jgi:hypothetical protein
LRDIAPAIGTDAGVSSACWHALASDEEEARAGTRYALSSVLELWKRSTQAVTTAMRETRELRPRLFWAGAAHPLDQDPRLRYAASEAVETSGSSNTKSSPFRHASSAACVVPVAR